MAKVIIAGDAVVVKSAIKYEDLKAVKKYRPEKLTLRGGEDGKEPIFTVFVRTDGNGSINANGVSFGAATRDEEKLATFTMIVKGDSDTDIKDYITSELGGALTNLKKIEEALPEVIAEIAAEKAAVLESIEEA